ncbi:restriction endonuclease subunit S [Robertmurraya andreesenii]|uniref:Type I restriction enzyme S subunit n=1 Tax=Anoxybacillus andreesenii TaxID=1325932 RepID=A0ABT9VAD9_9BACL|nr:restriction endonuclease subunit S [Robertmurraya andreesenii]MDQ0157927.1 type I restriction enzyme S subunit [Robertmurraya andreesenii]
MSDKVEMKKTNIGLIPIDWEVKKIEDISKNVFAGATPSTRNSEYWNGDIPWMSSGEINKKFIWSTEKKITKEGFNSSSTKMVPKDSVLVALAGQGKTRGTVAMNKIELCTNQSLASIVPDDTIEPKFLYYNLDSRYDELRKMSTGDGGRGGLNLKIINYISIGIPPLGEQKKIANILSTWDQAIVLKEKLIEQKKEQKKGIMQKILTGAVRLPGFDGEWKNVKLGKLIKEVNNKSTENNQFQVLSVTKNGIVAQSEHFNKQVASDNNIGYKIIRKNNLVFSTMNLWMGSLDVLTNFEIGIVSPAYKVFEFNRNRLNPTFGKYFMKAEHMIWIYNVNSEQGASIVRRNLDLKGLLNTNIKVPSIEEQMEIANLLSCVDKEIDLLEEETVEIKKQKKGLMKLLLTGKIRVKV